jgi:hypothetical protein
VRYQPYPVIGQRVFLLPRSVPRVGRRASRTDFKGYLRRRVLKHYRSKSCLIQQNLPKAQNNYHNGRHTCCYVSVQAWREARKRSRGAPWMNSIGSMLLTLQQLCERMLALKEQCIHPETGSRYLKSCAGGKDSSVQGIQVRDNRLELLL